MMQMFEIMYIEYFLTADESFKKHLINSIPVEFSLREGLKKNKKQLWKIPVGCMYMFVAGFTLILQMGDWHRVN